MSKITRRAALTAIPAMGAAAIVPAMATPFAESPTDKVVRIARELSHALDELNADTYERDFGKFDTSIWTVEVWPHRISQHVYLTQKDIPAALARFAASRP